jgi:pimeloyl-ACP methyl ester carboxylesterase
MKTTENFNFFLNQNPLSEYLIDASQRMVLFWDVMRQRGNQYLEQTAKIVPQVLEFDYDLILDGRKLKQPVNYGLVKIIPFKGTTSDDRKRPFVIFDPRAGHGPGIGGFKADSEIGEAMRAGHPCYFVGFSQMPEPGQTIEAVVEAWDIFLERAIELHPNAEGKPVAIGNCQAGWSVMMAAAKRPELCGPLILAGSPLSYWAGVRGVNPMRYTGGLLGGSWLTAMTSDLGHGKFDGAWLVQNFENLNPANTLWSKQYNLYAKIDTEAPRYLGFERWWNAHSVLNGEEIQYIVDHLFIGNKFSTAEMVTADGVRLDLRKIRSPIVCFCSKKDNITPPQQALGWILDLYQSVDDIRTAGQTIVYAVHDRTGHLGIFVSGSIAKKEHQEFATNIDLIDCLPPGLYEAVIQKKAEDDANPDLIVGDYISKFESRTLDDIRALGGNSLEDERCFAAVARLSEVTNGLYRTTLQPIVRSLATEQGAEWMRRLHPLRLSYEIFSNERNPAMKSVESVAQWVRENRQPAKPDNPFLAWQELTSDWIVLNLNLFQSWRDLMMEQMFFGIYSQPWLQAMLGLRASDAPPRDKPGQDPEHLAFIECRIQELRAGMERGGPREAAIRALIYVRLPERAADERVFQAILRTRDERDSDMTLSQFKETVRDQFLMLLIDERQAVAAIPQLLEGHQDEAWQSWEKIRRITTAGGSLTKEAEQRLAEMEKLFTHF